jgi:hypothetical protein
VERDGDVVVIPPNNSNVTPIPSQMVASQETFAVPTNTGATTMSLVSGAGFYSDIWGPLPYAFGPAPSGVYTVVRLKRP